MGDLGFAVRSVGISLGPGLVDFVDGPSLSADPPDLAAKQLMIGYLKNNEANGRERKDKGLRRTRATGPGLGVKPSARSLEPRIDPSRRGEAAVK